MFYLQKANWRLWAVFISLSFITPILSSNILCMLNMFREYPEMPNSQPIALQLYGLSRNQTTKCLPLQTVYVNRDTRIPLQSLTKQQMHQIGLLCCQIGDFSRNYWHKAQKFTQLARIKLGQYMIKFFNLYHYQLTDANYFYGI